MLQFKISKEEDNNKVSIKKDIDYPVFSFKHITTNKKYNINHFNKARDKAKAYGALFYIMDVFQNRSWLESMNLDKKNGFETISYKELNFNPKGFSLAKDDKLLIVRFKRGYYRMIGMKEDNIFHVFGFDFNYSAYDHGQ